MLPYDPTSLLRAKLEADSRPPDGLLHPSGDLTSSLRHVQLKAAGAPQLERDLVSEFRLKLGTLAHDWFETIFRGAPVMLEVQLDRWLPRGWSGRADWLQWDDARRAFVLGDLKSSKAEAMTWIAKDGMKESHIWQVSAYFWALVEMGLPMVNGFAVYYLPMNQLLAREGSPVSPRVEEGTPLPRDLVWGRMEERRAQVDAYLASLSPNMVEGHPGNYLTDALAPVQSRVAKFSLNKQLKVPAIDVKLAPHWSAAFCDFPDELCDCRQQGTNKIGHWRLNDGALVYEPTVEQADEVPSPPDDLIRKLRKELADASSSA